MFKKPLSFAVACILLYTFSFVKPTQASSHPEEKADFEQRLKEGVFKLGVGKDARVSIKLLDKTKVKGYISRADEESFVVTDAKTGRDTTVNYSNVAHFQGGVKKGYWIGVGIIVGLVLLLLIYDRTLKD